MAAPPKENPWDPDPNNPHMYKNGRNSTHYFTVSRVRTTSLDNNDMKYLRTYKNLSPSDSDHDIDPRDQKLLEFMKINYYEPEPNYASPDGTKLDHMLYLGGVCSVTHFGFDSMCAVRCPGAHL